MFGNKLPQIHHSGRTSVYLIALVLLLFIVWLGLKAPWQSSRRSSQVEVVETEDPKQSEKTDGAGKENELQNERTESPRESNGAGPNESVNSETTSPDNEDSQKEKKRVSSSSNASETSKSSSGGPIGEQRQEKTEPSDDDEQSSEENSTSTSSRSSRDARHNTSEPAEDTPQKNDDENQQTESARRFRKARKHFEEQRYEKALKRLDRLLTRTESSSRKQELMEFQSKLKSEYKRRRELAQKWLEKAETASEEKNWKQVIQNATNALDHIPDLKKARTLIDRAERMKTYQNMVRIPGGTYHYLNSSDQKPNGNKKRPKVDSFYIDRNEVTNSMYKQFIRDTGHRAPVGWDEREIPVGKDDHPVTGIAHADARAYAEWAGKRLPTANEWEIAARGETGRVYPWGNELEKKNEQVPANTLEAGIHSPVSVDEYQKGCTDKGICHLLGNVAEWTRTSIQAESGTLYVVKGGSYLYPAEKGKPSHRLLRDPDVTLMGIGFRCVKPPPEQ